MKVESIRLECGPQEFEVEIAVLGKGPPLVFLHALDGTEGAAPLLKTLAQDFTVYAPSHPGFGASSLPAGMMSMDDLAYFYLDLLAHLDLAGVTLVGSSLGGWLACEILVKDSSRFSDVILAGPLGYWQTDRRRNVLFDIFSVPAETWPGLFCETPTGFPAAHNGMAPDALLRIARNREAATLFGWSPHMSNPKLNQRLHRINKPVLMAWGSADRIAPVSYREGFASAVPSAKMEVLEGCGHFVHADNPGELAKMIARVSLKRT